MTRPAPRSKLDRQAGCVPACFDPALATAPTCLLPVDAIVDLLEVTHAPERIEEFRRTMDCGDRFPPVAVLRVGGRYFLADGHKRFSACKSLAVKEVVVEVWTLRRWLSDQRRQFVGKTRQQARLLVRCAFDRRARAQGVRLFWDTVGHWRRLGASLARRWHSRTAR
jgi:hypothetical protein